EAVEKKVREILEDPYRFKPLRAPMQNKRRVHVGPFVLVYEVDEVRRIVTILDFEHHDAVYRR
ncbi:MAG TPA: type II toxin-antitoxin system RelE/ParE family toxin, partial [Thermoplasmata archaeon]|nr:type II toxin-antitoxin system RelE/ParE family toxin [Thermoplasmata archaeon]